MPSERQLITETYLRKVVFKEDLGPHSFQPPMSRADMLSILKDLLMAVTGTEYMDRIARQKLDAKLNSLSDEDLSRMCEVFMKIGSNMANKFGESKITESQSGEQLARKFHNIYEKLAPKFGYETRKDTRDFDPSTPNGKLMIAVCEEILNQSSKVELQKEFAFPTAQPNWNSDGEIADEIEKGVQRIAGMADRTRLTNASKSLQQLYFDVMAILHHSSLN